MSNANEQLGNGTRLTTPSETLTVKTTPHQNKKNGKSGSKRARAKPEGRRRGRKPYPVITFEEASRIPQGIMEHASGHPIKRVTLLEKLKLTDNDSTRNLITSSSKYGITLGGYQAEEIALTPTGRLAVDPKASRRQQAQACFELAIKGVESFFVLYDRFKNGRLPAPEVLRDSLSNLDGGDRPQCVDIFISNSTAVGILKIIEGAQYLSSLETFLDELPANQTQKQTRVENSELNGDAAISAQDEKEDFEKVCFFIAPIGQEDSEHRQHSDAILASFVEHALIEHNLRVVRADKITKPGMISAQVIEYILKSKLVVADLSFHNPNVFYELALRHVTGKPTVHIIRESDKIPFDVGNFRTIAIKMDSIYSVLARLDTYRAEIAQQMRQVIADGTSTDNPILTFCPRGRFVLNEST